MCSCFCHPGAEARVQDLRSAFWLYVVENGINIVLAVALVGAAPACGAWMLFDQHRLHGGRRSSPSTGSSRTRFSTASTPTWCPPRCDGYCSPPPRWWSVPRLGSSVTGVQSVAGVALRLVVGTACGLAAYVLAAGLLAQRADRGRARARPPVAARAARDVGGRARPIGRPRSSDRHRKADRDNSCPPCVRSTAVWRSSPSLSRPTAAPPAGRPPNGPRRWDRPASPVPATAGVADSSPEGGAAIGPGSDRWGTR